MAANKKYKSLYKPYACISCPWISPKGHNTYLSLQAPFHSTWPHGFLILISCSIRPPYSTWDRIRSQLHFLVPASQVEFATCLWHSQLTRLLFGQKKLIWLTTLLALQHFSQLFHRSDKCQINLQWKWLLVEALANTPNLKKKVNWGFLTWSAPVTE